MRYVNIAGKPLSFAIDSVHYEVPMGGEVEIPERLEYVMNDRFLGVLRPLDGKQVTTGGETRVIVDTARAKADRVVSGEEAVAQADKNTIIVKDQSKPGPETAAISAQSQQEKAAAYNPDLRNEVVKGNWVAPLDLDPASTHQNADKGSAETHFPNLKIDPDETGKAKPGTGDYEVGHAAAGTHIDLTVPPGTKASEGKLTTEPSKVSKSNHPPAKK